MVRSASAITSLHPSHIALVTTLHSGRTQYRPAKVSRRAAGYCRQQAVHVCETTVVQDAWRRGQPLAVRAWIYGLEDGHLRDLGFHATGPEELRPAMEKALEVLAGKV